MNPHKLSTGTLVSVLRAYAKEMQANDDTASAWLKEAADRLEGLNDGIIETLESNRELADGEACSLVSLKRLVPDWE